MIRQECEPIKVLMNQKISLVTLSFAPKSAYKALEYILNQYEDEHSQHHPFDVRRLSLPGLFAILPKPSVHWRFVTISAYALSAFVRERLPRDYSGQLELFQRVFNFNAFKNVYKRIEDLIPNEENKILFRNIVKSDELFIDFMFYRRAVDENEDEALIRNHNLGVNDFSMEEVAQLYRPSLLDPGRKTVYTAVMGLDQNQHEIRRCTTKEYYHLTGSTVSAKNLQPEKDAAGITAIESTTPTLKTARNISFLRFANHLLSNIDKLFAFYGFRTAKYRFNLYQGKHKAPEMMVNMLLNSGAKYNRKNRFKKKNKKGKRRNKKKRLLVSANHYNSQKKTNPKSLLLFLETGCSSGKLTPKRNMHAIIEMLKFQVHLNKMIVSFALRERDTNACLRFPTALEQMLVQYQKDCLTTNTVEHEW
ncbi:MAG: hypothetical protein EXX96DRAFT_618384 [Benjaminiella poitrasii]|nr:MAG: hypothetical protein EXX96DRAFT_618384 [Benjaminiella poitrasii]